MEKFEIQVPKEHYYKNYDDHARFISYFYQINLVIKTNPKTILEIGIGNKTVSNYLRQHGFDVTTCDFDNTLGPNKVADIRDLPFENNEFDVVVACEILEHIPFNDVSTALSELKRVSKKNVVISIPYSCFFVEIVHTINIPSFYKQLSLVLSVPFFAHDFKKTNEHYWEMGCKQYSKRKIRTLFKKYFTIKKETQPILDTCHYFFVLEKRELE